PHLAPHPTLRTAVPHPRPRRADAAAPAWSRRAERFGRPIAEMTNARDAINGTIGARYAAMRHPDTPVVSERRPRVAARLRYVDATRQHGVIARVYAAFAATRFARFI